MILIKLAFGLIFFILGWIYLYKSNVVLYLNRFAREQFFNDRIVLLERKKLAVLFFCLSFVALYMGVSSLTKRMTERDSNNWLMETNNYLMYMAMQDYCTERYQSALEKYQKVLKSEPDNFEAWNRVAFTYTALGDKKKARAIWKRILLITPSEHVAKAIRERLDSLEK